MLVLNVSKDPLINLGSVAGFYLSEMYMYVGFDIWTRQPKITASLEHLHAENMVLVLTYTQRWIPNRLT